MLSVRGDVAPSIRAHGIQFVHFIFGKSNRAKIIYTQAKTKHDKNRQRANDEPFHS
jgi:hypothetical protein